jgi:hypothetical protein
MMILPVTNFKRLRVGIEDLLIPGCLTAVAVNSQMWWGDDPELRVDKELEGGGRGRFQGTIQTLHGYTAENHDKP